MNRSRIVEQMCREPDEESSFLFLNVALILIFLSAVGI